MKASILRLISPALLLPLGFALACSDDGGGGDDVGPETSDSGTTDSGSTDTGDSTDSSDTGLEEPDPLVDWPTLACDSLVPEYCLFPFPNNVFTAADDSTVTGRRLALITESLPTKYNNPIEAEPFNDADGFSAGQAALTYLADAATTGLPTWENIEASLDPGSPTVLIDAETGEWIPHFSEIDESLAGDPDGALMIRPVIRLQDNHRYIVAVRKVVNSGGELIAPSAQFQALRDLQPSDDPNVEARRPLYADIFARLEQAGVERGTLQIAWDYTTASMEHNTGALLHMRDEAMAGYGEGLGPSYMITDVDAAWNNDDIAYKIEGTIEVPLYLDSPDSGGVLVYGADGMPEQQGSAEFPFVVIIPNSALETPAPILQYGHGLLGGHTEVQTGHMRSFANQYNYVLVAVDWIGMADEDTLVIAGMLTQGTLHEFVKVSDRLQQGMLNFLLATRMMKTSFAADPSFGQYIDPSNAYYLGISQGGIFGGTFMALSQDVERGCVGVPGQPYNILLNRSVDFDTYFALLQQGFPDSRDLQINLALIQMLWDHAEPNGYSYKVSDDPFPDTPAHELLIRAAIGDHQVTTLGAHIMARAVGAPHLDTGIRDVYGLDPVMSENAGSTYVEYDFGLPPDPLINHPQEACEDPHGKLRKLEEARMQLDTFFRTGVVQNTCLDGVCSFPDMSGCP